MCLPLPGVDHTELGEARAGVLERGLNGCGARFMNSDVEKNSASGHSSSGGRLRRHGPSLVLGYDAIVVTCAAGADAVGASVYGLASADFDSDLTKDCFLAGHHFVFGEGIPEIGGF